MADDVAGQIAILEAMLGRPAAYRRPRHPETGCPCTSCLERDDYLETLAEQRAAARRGE